MMTLVTMRCYFYRYRDITEVTGYALQAGVAVILRQGGSFDFSFPANHHSRYERFLSLWFCFWCLKRIRLKLYCSSSQIIILKRVT
jgi:hypothetical protein